MFLPYMGGREVRDLTRVNIASPIASSMLSLASIATEPGEAWWGVVRSGEEW